MALPLLDLANGHSVRAQTAAPVPVAIELNKLAPLPAAAGTTAAPAGCPCLHGCHQP